MENVKRKCKNTKKNEKKQNTKKRTYKGGFDWSKKTKQSKKDPKVVKKMSESRKKGKPINVNVERI